MADLMSGDLPIIPFDSATAWETWLEDHHATDSGVWVKFAKKASGIATVTYAEAVEMALCFGWIDGQRNGLDEEWYLQRFTPRRARSRWSMINRDKAEQLVDRDAMRPAGLREIERAQADGRWAAAYPSPRNIEVPDDLQRALDADPTAAATFAELNAANRYAILSRIHDARRPETRTRRIEDFVGRLGRGEKTF